MVALSVLSVAISNSSFAISYLCLVLVMLSLNVWWGGGWDGEDGGVQFL